MPPDSFDFYVSQVEQAPSAENFRRLRLYINEISAKNEALEKEIQTLKEEVQSQRGGIVELTTQYTALDPRVQVLEAGQ